MQEFLRKMLFAVWDRLVKAVRPSCREADKREKLRKRLQEKVKKHGWKLLLLLCFLFTCCTSFSETIYVPAGTPVKLREDVKAKVWVLVDGEELPEEMVLKSGWFVLSED